MRRSWAMAVASLALPGLVTVPTAGAASGPTVTLPVTPSSIAVSMSGATVYAIGGAGGADNYRLLTVDAATRKVVADVHLTEGGTLSLSADGSRLYVEGYAHSQVMDTSTGAMVAPQPTVVATVSSADGQHSLAVGPSDGTVTVRDAAGSVLVASKVAEQAFTAWFNPAGDRIVVLTGSNRGGSPDGLVLLDSLNLSVIARTAATGFVSCVEQSPSRDRIYAVTANALTIKGIVAVDASTLAPLARVEMGNRMDCPRITPDGTRLYATVMDDGTSSSATPIVAVDTALMTRVGQVDFPSEPATFDLNPGGTQAWVSQQKSLQLVTLATSLRPPAALPWTGPVSEFTGFQGVQVSDARMSAMVARTSISEYGVAGPESTGYESAWAVIVKGGVTRLADQYAHTITYSSAAQVCSRTVTRRFGYLIAADRRARWKCRARTALDDPTARVLALRPSAFSTFVPRMLGDTIQSPIAQLQNSTPSTLSFGVYRLTSLGYRPYTFATYTFAQSSMRMVWDADDGQTGFGGRITLRTTHVPDLPSMSSLRR